MKYFLHDCNAHQDEKLTELLMQFGYEGYGLFFAVLERIGLQEKPVKTAVLKKQLGVGKKLEKAWQFMEEIELICSTNGETFNNNLLKFAEKYQIKNEKTRKRMAQFRENQRNPKSVTHNKRVSNARKVKESKVKESNTISTDADASAELVLFEQFFDAYGKKVDKKKCLLKWQKLTPIDHRAILQNVPDYVRQNPNYNFRKNPLTYLNGECWKDPLEPTGQPDNRPAGALPNGMVI